MTHRALLLADDADPHASAVAWALREHGVEPIWLPSLLANRGPHYTFHIDAEGMQFRDGTLGGAPVSAVWNRRLQDPEPHCAEPDRVFATWEWRLFQRNVFNIASSYGDALWINRLSAAQRAECKLVQLACCRDIGLPFPETMVTTDAAEVDALRRRWGRVIFKSFSTHQWEDASSGEQHAVGVSLIDADTDLPADALAVCPGIYQRYIEKSCDIRVTVVGDRLFAIRLGRSRDRGYVDWRSHSNDPELFVEAITLPSDIEAKLRTLMRWLNLVFGCIDLAVDREGGYHFLEVNQAGQFLFVEDMIPDLPVLQAVTSMIAIGRTDYTLDAGPRVSMHDFRDSDAYQALRERTRQKTASTAAFTVE
ncbi:hypothetical protein GCM10027285_25650 [Oleiagrimonas citrea]|uniref:ATP-grasp domain-containing protein n=1 Tax=Oleiagrimonas citrea TaxID=1665687 RepID=A0A846ZML6_9GAMM|nr:hypothetical protein [Oleiagrimonas citrea]NKZ38907.1 hypothetical protein [Oleiagrimonas citrea]